MAFATPQELVRAFSDPRRRANLGAVEIMAYRSDGFSYTPAAGPINEATAREWINGMKAAILAHRQSKVNRPYQIVDVTADLDPAQAWVGWEVECGFRTHEEYERVINYLWRYHNHVTVDNEGWGAHRAEITFSPQNADDAFGSNSKPLVLMRWLQKVGIERPTYQGSIGTHLNVSTPAFRELDWQAAHRVANALSRGLMAMSPDDCELFFGRARPYGWAYAQRSGRKQWVEFKLFLSTLNQEQFARYQRTGRKLAELIEALSLNQIPMLDTSRIPQDYQEWLRESDRMRSSTTSLGPQLLFVEDYLQGRRTIDQLVLIPSLAYREHDQYSYVVNPPLRYYPSPVSENVNLEYVQAVVNSLS